MKTEIKMCPICSEPIPNREHAGKYVGAISRKDNVTEICSACGNAEAMAEYFPYEKREIKDAIFSQNEILIQLEKRIEEYKSNGGELPYLLVLDEKADAVLKTIFGLRMRLQKL